MAIVKLDATLDDGSVVTIFPVAAAPTITEVDVKVSDGTTETFTKTA